MSQSLRAAMSDRPITLTQKIASSGEGTVWTTSFPGFLAKLYHQPTRDRIDKLKVMIAHPPQNPMRHHHHVTFAWPQDLLVDAQGQALGFLMPEIVDGVKLSLIYNPKLRSRKAPRFNWYYLHTAALNFALALKSLHEEGYVVGDVKPQNLLVNNRALISVIDTDSFQVRDPLTQTLYRCLVGSEGFTPVELLGKELSTLDQQEVHDRFRLGVMVYLLLFGDQPFKGKWVGRGDSPQPSELIRQGSWPYAPNSLVQPGPNTIPLSVIHPQLQVCFQRCFTAGHRNPQDRPSAQDWGDALKLAIVDLRMCHIENNHHYSRTYGRCYWCDRRSSVGFDIFSPLPASPRKLSAGQSAAKSPTPRSAIAQGRILATTGLSSFQQMPPLRAATALLQSGSAPHRHSSLLSRWQHPALWGAGCIILGLLGLTILLLPELNTELFGRGMAAVEATLQNQLRSSKKVVSNLKNSKLRSELIPAASVNLIHGGHWDGVSALDLSRDDRFLVSGSKDMTVKLWSFPEGKLRHTFSDHYEPVISVNLSNNAQTLVTSGLSGKVLAWDVKTFALDQNFPLENNLNSEGSIRNAATDAMGNFVASSGWGGTIVLQYLKSGKVIRIPSNSLTSEQALVAFPNGQSIITSSSDGRFQIWNAATGLLERTFPERMKENSFEPINVLAISQDGKFLASGGWYGSLSLWNIAQGTLVKRFPKQDKPISVISISDGNDQLATVNSNATIQIWDMKTGVRRSTLQDQAGMVLALKYSHHGDVLISGSDEPAIKVWNLKMQRVIQKLVQ
jgi:WD40 repeat protein/serine/threonine protein kinase